MPLVSVIIVNYWCASMTRRAVQSICENKSNISTEIIVVDNSASESEHAELRNYVSTHAKIIVSDRNEGFGRACNLAFEESSGDFILLLNPDAYLLPGAIEALVESLVQDKRRGAVAPRTYWDDDKKFVLPPMPMPSPWDCARGVLLRRFIRISKLYQLLWRQQTRRMLERKNTFKQKNISGGVVLLRKEAVNAAGGLFDSRFFLYFEDADLCRRLHNAGYILGIEPQAEAVHHYNQTGGEFAVNKPTYFAESLQKFNQKYDVRGFARKACGILNRLFAAKTVPSVEYLGRVESPLSFEVPQQIADSWILEISPNMNLIPAAMCMSEGTVAGLTAEAWRLLAPGRYYIRLGGSHNFQPYKTWALDIIHSSKE